MLGDVAANGQHAPGGNYCHPDVTVVCGELEYHNADPDSVLNPTVIVEVLSHSTEAHDRGAKFDDYRSIPSLKEYVLVSQDRTRVEVLGRATASEATWRHTFYGESDTVALPSLGIELPMTDLYEGAFELRGDGERSAVPGGGGAGAA